MVRSVCRLPFAKSREGWGTHFFDSASGGLGRPPGNFSVRATLEEARCRELLF